MTETDLAKIQQLLADYKLDGWLFTDFHGHDFITNDFLGLSGRFCTRRLFYYIPAHGEPVKLLSAIEPLLLDHLPGRKILYKGYQGQKKALSQILSPGLKVACQYSPGGNVPTISSMDAGLIEYLKSFGIQLCSSANLMQYFGAVLTESQIESHRAAGVIIHRILNRSFQWIRSNIDKGNYIDEWMLLQEMKRLIQDEPEIEMEAPFFGIDEHASDPGYEPCTKGSKQIVEGSRLIVDIAGRLKGNDTIYYDVSWCMQVGRPIDQEYQRIFDIVNQARQRALEYIQKSLDKGQNPKGCDVDAHLRGYFASLHMDQYLMHRTGHNIGHQCHGIGANVDDYETHDDRELLPGTMFSIEPGIYTEKYGVRLEYDVHITPERKLKIYGPIQKEILVI